jgi:hypothetical protein
LGVASSGLDALARASGSASDHGLLLHEWKSFGLALGCLASTAGCNFTKIPFTEEGICPLTQYLLIRAPDEVGTWSLEDGLVSLSLDMEPYRRVSGMMDVVREMSAIFQAYESYLPARQCVCSTTMVVFSATKPLQLSFQALYQKVVHVSIGMYQGLNSQSDLQNDLERPTWAGQSRVRQGSYPGIANAAVSLTNHMQFRLPANQSLMNPAASHCLVTTHSLISLPLQDYLPGI